MTVALWIAAIAAAWLVVAYVAARLLGGATRIRDRQVPDTGDDPVR